MDLNAEYIQASRKRLVLAWYLDYILLSVLVGHISIHFFKILEVPFYAELISLLVFEALFLRLWVSPGMYMLGISKQRVTVSLEGTGTKTDTRKMVPREIYESESFISMLAGTLLILEGSKNMIRWAMWTPPLPVLGFETDAVSNAFFSTAMGLAGIAAGYLFFKLRRTGFYIAILLYLYSLISIVLSWEKWDAIIETMVVLRREYQGIPVRSHEVEFMQSVMPESLVAGTLIMMLLFILSYRRLKFRD